MATRREKVVLELEDNFSSGMARAAASAALLKRELGTLDGKAVKSLGDDTARVGDETARTSKQTKEYTYEMALADEKSARLRKSLRDQAKATLDAGNEVEKLSKKANDGGRDIDRFSGRLGLLAEAAFTIGPGLIPIGAAAIPAVTGLAAGVGALAAGLGVGVLAVHGMGDALKAFDAAQVEPTQQNLAKMREEMDKLGPAGAHFVRFLDGLEPDLRSLQNSARAGLFPGVEKGINHLLTMLPQVRRIIFDVATEMGHLANQTGKGLSGDGFARFFKYLQTDAVPMMEAFAHTIGNVAQGLGSLLVAFAPLSRGFAAGMESMSASFAHWAAGLSKTQGFRDFVSYIQHSAPQVLDLLGSLANAFVGIVTAAAPVGNAVLPALTALANVIGAIGNSPIGPPLYAAAVALMAVNRAASLATGTLTRVGVSAETASAKVGKIAKTAGGLAAVGMAVGAIADGIGRINAQDVGRNLDALANGQSTGDIQTVVSNLSDLESKWNSIDLGEVVTAGGLFGDTSLDRESQNIEQIDQALAGLVESGHAKKAAEAYAEIVKQAAAPGVSAETVAKHFDAYGIALDNSAAAADRSAHSDARYADATRAAGNAAAVSRAQITGMMNAMKEQRSAALSAFDAITQYSNALADARKQAAKSNAGIDLSKAKTRQQHAAIAANRDALSQLAQAWNNQGDAIKNNLDKFAQARAQFIQTAVAMHVPRKAAQLLADQLMEIPRTVTTKVTTLTATALAALAEARRQLAAMDGLTATTYIRTIRTGPGGTQGSESFHYASGGEVRGPGSTTSDSIPAWLSNGEHVWTAREVANAGGHAAVEALRGRYRFADGGPVQQPQPVRRRANRTVVSVSSPSLTGLRIEGRLETNDRGESYLRGVVREEIEAADMMSAEIARAL